MIIWSGRGILIPFIGILGFLGGAFITGSVFRMLGIDPLGSPQVGMSFPPFIAAGLLWWFGSTWGRTQEQLLLDPRTQQQVFLRSRHTLFFMTGKIWAVIALVLGLMSALRPAEGLPGATAGSKTLNSAFTHADDLLIGKSKGLAHGNTEEAKRLATEFAAFLKDARNLGIQKKSSGTVFSTTGGEFLTYCHLIPVRCAFLVHVPELRKFSGEAKDYIAEAAWVAALSVLQPRLEGLKSVSVGIRGALLYDRVVAGKAGPVENYASLRLSDVNGNDESREFLSAIFEAPSAPAQNTPPMTEVVSTLGENNVAAALDKPSTPATAEPATKPSSSTALKKSDQPAEPAPKASVARIRDWKDANGRPLRAAFVRFMDTDRKEAEFQREDGQFFVIPVARFSEADREYLLRLPAF